MSVFTTRILGNFPSMFLTTSYMSRHLVIITVGPNEPYHRDYHRYFSPHGDVGLNTAISHYSKHHSSYMPRESWLTEAGAVM